MGRFTEIKIKKNKPPEGGSCTLLENYGYAMITKFEITCGGWKDPEAIGIKSYTYFFYQIKNGVFVKTVLASTTLIPLNIYLPVGNFSLVVEILDDYSGTTLCFLGNATANLPDKESIEDFDYLAQIQYFSSNGDQTSLAMLLNALSSIRDNAEWLSLDESALQNFTLDELTNRLMEISELNQDQLKAVSQTMNFETLSQIEVGTNVVKEAVSGIFNNNLSSLTIDITTRDMAISSLETMTTKLPNIYISSPQSLTTILTSTLEATNALLKGVAQVLHIGETKKLVPPIDQKNAINFDYEVDIGTGDYDLEIPTLKSDMVQQNVLDTTRLKAKADIERINAIVNNIFSEIRRRMVINEKVETTAPHGASALLWKLTEEEIRPGLEIFIQNNRGRVVLPREFCPSEYIYSNTNCKKNFEITALVWPCINFIYPHSTSLLAIDTSVIALDITIDNNPVRIKNETSGIKIDIPRKGEIKTTWLSANARENMSHLQNIVYHYFNVSKPGSGFAIEIQPHNEEFPNNVILLVDYERIPTPEKYMKMVLLKDLDRNINGTYIYFVSSDENSNKTGRFYVGIGRIKNAQQLGNNNQTLKKEDFDENFSSSYFFRAYSSGCYYFNEEQQEWSSMEVKMLRISSLAVQCQTTHTSSFGSGYFELPNLLNFEYIFAHPGFIDNYSLYITLIILIAMYIIMMIWGHWMDRKDIEHRGVIPLPDNKPEDKYLYEITFHTGPDKDATTDSNINFILSGDYAETEVRTLPPANNFLYRRFAVNSFVMANSRPLGDISFLRVFHDNSGEPPLDNWQLHMVTVRDLQTAQKFVFDINGWLAFDQDKRTIDRIFTLSTDEKDFTQNLNIRTNKAANEDHMWLSIFMKPSGSRYCRKERITVSFVFLFLSMLSSALWYNTSPESKRNSLFDLGPFTLSASVILTGICTLFFAFPVVYFLALIFKRARPRRLKKCRALDSIEKQRKKLYEEKGVSKEDSEKLSKLDLEPNKSSRPKEISPIKCIPWWTRILAWIFCFAAFGIAVFLVWSYGIMWGEIKTAKWLSSFIISFVLSIIIVQWLKVILISCFSTIIAKYDLTVEDIDCDEELPSLKMDESWSNQTLLDPSLRRKVYKVEGVDFNNPEVYNIGKRLEKNREIKKVIKEILIYCVFLAVVYIISSERTDQNAILLKKHYVDTFIKGHPDIDFETKVIIILFVKINLI